MKVKLYKQWNSGITRIDVVVVVLLVGVLFAMIMPIHEAAQRRDANITCMGNLKQVNVALRVWELDNDKDYAELISKSNKSVAGLNTGQKAWRNLMGTSNFLSSAKVLQCPRDNETPITTNADGLKIRISYFLNLDAMEGYPQELLDGDDNFVVGGVRVTSGILGLSSNTSISWAPGRHGRVNNIGLADGSVEQQSSLGLQNTVSYSFKGTPFSTNRIAIP
jgi:prepilin-type processing-associated H-X9-DG protein